MVTKAEIQSIDFAGNTCVVRMPYFESAAGGDKAIATAIFSNTPGTFNGYKVGDIVLVAFEDGQAQQPCVIGKLYLGMAEENKEARGTINAEALTSSSTNSLPLSTKLTSDILDNTADSNAGANSFKTIKELAEAVQNNTNAIGIAGYQTYSLAEQAIGTWIDGKTIYRKTYAIDISKKATASGVNWNVEIDYSTLRAAKIWTDMTHTFIDGTGTDNDQYSLNSYNAPAGDYFNTFIDIINKKIHARGYCAGSFKNLYITVEYTKA